jgi:hypothetical protein
MAAATDPKHGFKDNNILGPALNFALITPTDSTAFTFGLTRALYVGTAGNVNVYDKDGTAVLFTGVTAGTVLPIRAGGVASTNTTASTIVALKASTETAMVYIFLVMNRFVSATYPKEELRNMSTEIEEWDEMPPELDRESSEPVRLENT